MDYKVEGKVTFIRIKDLIEQHLRSEYDDLDKFYVTFYKVEELKSDETWYINVEFTIKIEKDSNKKHVASFMIRAGEVTEYEQGRIWTF